MEIPVSKQNTGFHLENFSKGQIPLPRPLINSVTATPQDYKVKCLNALMPNILKKCFQSRVSYMYNNYLTEFLRCYLENLLNSSKMYEYFRDSILSKRTQRISKVNQGRRW